jgi:predicted nucleotidyltransferase
MRALMDEGVVIFALVSKGSQFFELNQSHILTKHLVAIDHAKDDMLDVVRGRVAQWPREPRAVVLFGSVARNDDTSASDIDLLVVWKGKRAPSEDWNSDKIRLAEAVQASVGSVANIVDFSGPEWEAAVAAEERLVGEIARDGVSVTGTAVRTLTRNTANVAAK